MPHRVDPPRERLAVGISVLLIVLPLAEIAALGTTNNVSARYIVFVQPFYYLLIGRCVQFLTAGLTNRRWRYAWVRLPAAAGSSGVLLITLAGLLVFAAGGLGYYAPNGYSAARFKVDYRSAAGYLATRLRPEDTVVFIDDPPHGVDVSRFYWHWHDPAHIYDVRDPRLATVTPAGAVYWVVGLFYGNPVLLDRLAAQGWADTARFFTVAVLRDPPSSAGLLDRQDRVVGRIAAIDGFSPAMRTIRGSLAQDHGAVQQAVALYAGNRAGFLGPAHLATSLGFARLGDSERAWQQAMLSKYNLAGSPDLHRWLADLLAQAGAPAQSQIEQQIADRLLRSVTTRSRPGGGPPGQRPPAPPP